MPYLTNAEENELKRLEKTTDEDFFAVKHFGPQKAGKALLLGIGEERGEVGCGFKSGIFLS
jgi:hypothetical protein